MRQNPSGAAGGKEGHSAQNKGRHVLWGTDKKRQSDKGRNKAQGNKGDDRGGFEIIKRGHAGSMV